MDIKMGNVFKGNESEFEQIVNDNKGIVYSVVLANLKYASEVDDIVQETFIYAYYNFETLREEEKVRAWLCGIARNQSLKANRSRKNTVVTDFSDISPELLETGSPEDTYIEQCDREYLIQGIRMLSPKLRETVIMFYIAGNSVKEIAEILAIPEGTVKFRLNDARKKLKKELVNVMSIEKKKIEDTELYEIVQANIDKVYDYLYTQHLPRKASELCDETIEMISNLTPDKNDPVHLLYNLYYAKAHSLIGVERVKALDYYKKALEVVENSGDIKWTAQEYKNYAVHLSNAKREKSLVLEYHKKALELAKDCGDELIYVENLASFAGDMSEVRNSDRGLPQFEEVLSYKDKLIQTELNTINIYLFAYGEYKALSAVKEKGHLHDVDYVSSASYKFDEHCNIINSSFFCTDYMPSEFSTYIFRYKPQMHQSFLPDNVLEAEKSEWESNSWFTYNTVKSTKEIVSMTEQITVLGEKYNDCLHIRVTDVLNDDETDTSRNAELNRQLNGVTDIWYAPNVGVVRYQMIPIKGEKYSIELSEYKINNKDETGDKKKYLPIALGNTWRYKSFVGDKPSSDIYDYDIAYETLLEKDGNHYVSNWAYVYKK